jgi:hypothetical protein
MEYVYKGTAYKQGIDPYAPWLVNFVAVSEDISEWAGIPRRSERGLVGFQRPDDPNRVDRAQEFFKNPANQSPTTLILGVHPVQDESQRRVFLRFIDNYDDSNTRQCEIKVILDENDNDLSSAIEIIKSQIQIRLTSAEKGQSDEEDSEEETSENGESDEDYENGSGDEEIELGKSLLLDLAKKLEDYAWCEAHQEDLLDLSKPCTVIDGQHRLKGAVGCERRIPFSVIAIFDCPWPEQVFQFTVVNYTSKGIPDQFITANAALSLTFQELEDLKTRLTQAKIKVTEYELMKVVNFNPASPFYQKVSMASQGNESDKIGYKTMVKVAKAWHSGKDSAVKQIIANLYPDLKGKPNYVRRERMIRWSQDDWGLFFVDFWKTIHDYYVKVSPSNYNVWDVGSSNFMIAAVLLEFQNAFFVNLAQQDEDFFLTDPEKKQSPIEQLREKIRKRAEKVASFIPVGFFQVKWKMTSLNNGVGRVALQTALKALVENKGAYQYEKSTVVTGTTS